MKKRLLCALLAAAMCLGETLSASAVTVSTNDVETEQTGTISENTTEVDAEKEAATIYPDGKVPTKWYLIQWDFLRKHLLGRMEKFSKQ